MEFKEFKELMQSHFTTITKNQTKLFFTDVDTEILWETYLNSFPSGTNEIYRERGEFDCSCCKHFIRSFGNVVVLDSNKIKNIWEFKTNDDVFQPVIDALSLVVKSAKIKDVFITKESSHGTDKNFEESEDGTVQTWEHFNIKLPKIFVSRSTKSEGSLKGAIRDVRNVFQRSLEEINQESIETILELIAQKSLYKGDEWQTILNNFLTIHKEYHKLPKDEKDNYVWTKSIEVGGVIGKIKNHSIGVLLSDVSDGMDLNLAVKRYEAIVAPSNYKRPKAIYTKKMIEQAQKTLTELGYLDSLERRFANIEDITINNILFANKDSIKKIAPNVFEEMSQEVSLNPKKFDKIEEVQIEDFINDILPSVTNIEVMLENKHASNFVSVIAPKNKDSKTMFKWNNNYSWVYSGNMTDGMKDLVKSKGGKVDGVLRFSIQWNENGDNQNDFDAHCIEPNRNEIYFPNKRRIHLSTGVLDVDIQQPGVSETAVENITWSDINKMQKGVYKFFVHNYSNRGGRSGFRAEIEYDGQIYSYEYNKEIKNKESVVVAELVFDKNIGIQFVKSLESTNSSRQIWELTTNKFQPVSLCMFSPNYWDKQSGIGHRHYFFIINECRNSDRPNGFFNEFLQQNLLEHKRVFEALGGKMRVEDSDEQLSGLGFSSTKRNSLICKVDGNFSRTIKLIF